jgi:fructose/tagatose bisphosphate aldolase
MKSAVEAGINKVIIFSDVVKGVNDSIRKVLENSDAGVNPLFYLQDSQNEAKKIIKKKLITFGSVNKA